MRFLVISRHGDSLGLAMRLQSEKQDVAFFNNNRAGAQTGQDLTYLLHASSPLVSPSGRIYPDTLKHMASWMPNVITFDDPAFGGAAKFFNDNGFPTIGASTWAKALGDADYHRRAVEALSLGFDEHIGPHVSEAWWSGGERITPWFLGAEDDRLMEGDLGPAIGGMGLVMRPENIDALDEIGTALERVKHVGPVRIRWGRGGGFSAARLEAHLSPAYLSAISESLSIPLWEFLEGIATGRRLRGVNAGSDWVASCCLSIPPFPYRARAPERIIGGEIDGAERHAWLCDARLDKDKLVGQTVTGKTGFITAHGPTRNGGPHNPWATPGLSGAVNRVYRTVQRIEIEDIQYRRDIGSHAQVLFQREDTTNDNVPDGEEAHQGGDSRSDHHDDDPGAVGPDGVRTAEEGERTGPDVGEADDGGSEAELGIRSGCAGGE